MDRNLLLAVSLSVAVYAAWFGFLEKRFNPQPAKPLAGAVAPGAKPSAAKSADAASAAPLPR